METNVAEHNVTDRSTVRRIDRPSKYDRPTTGKTIKDLEFCFSEPVKPQSRHPLEKRHLSGSYTDSSVPGSVNNRPFRDRQQRPEPEVDCSSAGKKEPQGDAGFHDEVK